MVDMYIKVYKNTALVRALRIADALCVLSSLILFSLLCVQSFTVGLVSLVKLLFAAGIPFVFVSVFRRLLNAPRPYELYDFHSLGLPVPRSGKGCSFPSRHAFSAALIAVLSFSLHPAAGVIGAFCALLVALSRAVRGIHFVRDVVVGLVSGGACGAIGVFAFFGGF